MFGPVEAMHAKTLEHLPAGSFPQGKVRLLQLADRAQIGFPPRGVLLLSYVAGAVSVLLATARLSVRSRDEYASIYCCLDAALDESEDNRNGSPYRADGASNLPETSLKQRCSAMASRPQPDTRQHTVGGWSIHRGRTSVWKSGRRA